MVEKTLTVRNRAGIHARPSALIVKTAIKFKSEVYLERGNDRINAKSIMGLLTLGAAYGTKLKVIAVGPDGEQAVAAIEQIFDSRFEED
ncbi:MAG: HPr family phosphocarrier protein [Treponema sp.]|jgi:phosphocarrier protein|nr:HPr family phosphocarrier protein [Treponema sp.]